MPTFLLLILLDSDFLRSTGKIYSVALVALVIWIGILFYLISLDKKLKKLEDQIKE